MAYHHFDGSEHIMSYLKTPRITPADYNDTDKTHNWEEVICGPEIHSLVCKECRVTIIKTSTGKVVGSCVIYDHVLKRPKKYRTCIETQAHMVHEE